MSSFDQQFDRAMAAAGKKPARPTGEPDKIASLSRALAAIPYGEPGFGDARSALWVELEAGLRTWIRENPPTHAPWCSGPGSCTCTGRYKIERGFQPTSGTVAYLSDDPSRAVWLYRDDLQKNPAVTIHVVHDVLFGGPQFEKVARKAIASLKSKKVGGDREKVAARFPEYPDLLVQIREAKRIWNAADAAVKSTHAFRMMGGLTRIGTPESVRYQNLVQRAQGMEKTVLLGRILTGLKKAS